MQSGLPSLDTHAIVVEAVSLQGYNQPVVITTHMANNSEVHALAGLLGHLCKFWFEGCAYLRSTLRRFTLAVPTYVRSHKLRRGMVLLSCAVY